MFCVVQTLERKKPNTGGEYREYEVQSMTIGFQDGSSKTHYSYYPKYEAGRFPRPHRECFKISMGAAFLCRKCAGLNYRSNQETRSDSMYYYSKGVALVEKHLDTFSGVRPDGFSFCRWLPERPRYMHETTYRRYLRRFAKYQHHHQKRQMEDMLKILGWFR